MKIVSINALHYGSTGKIMLGISEVAKEYGYESYTFSKNYNKTKEIEGHCFIGTPKGLYIESKLSVYSGFEGIYSRRNTRNILKELEHIQPDVIHLHNLHGWYLNFKMLFDYIRKNNIKTIWTLHDCWSFTGHCPYFDLVQCERWKDGCGACTQRNVYPQICFDFTRQMYKLKKKWFSGVQNLTIVTPSEWLKGLVKESFLKEYEVRVIRNGIDLGVFKPTSSDFRNKYNIADDDIMLLGVAFDWGKRKGLDVVIDLAKKLDSSYKIVLVGTDAEIDAMLPKNVISINRTQNQTELAEIYSAADIFINPTREENYPTVNMESIACGTPVITFRTGGSPEILGEVGGLITEENTADAMIKLIEKLGKCSEKCSRELCEYAKAFDYRHKYEQYIELYQES